MPAMGEVNAMTVVREMPQGLYLVDADAAGDEAVERDAVLLPFRYMTDGMEVGDTLEVFVYRDSEGRPVATTETPRLHAGQIGKLRVVDAEHPAGAFLDWGLSKDLLLPKREQRGLPLREGEEVIVAVYVDKTDAVVASRRIDRHLPGEPPDYEPNQKVDVLIYGMSPLGYKAVVNGRHGGLLYRSESAAVLKAGDARVAYVKQVRPDGKVDLRRDPAGYERVDALSRAILTKLDEADGTLALNDKSSPSDIRAAFDTSKKAFKQALGALYKQRHIRFTETGIERAGGG